MKGCDIVVDVVAIKFYKNGVASGKSYYFKTEGIEVKEGYDVIITTERGEELVCAVSANSKVDEKKVAFELKSITRVATKKDRANKNKNIKENQALLEELKTFITERINEMQVISAEYTLNREQLLITYVSENRVDFRDLLKDLAGKYRTRIELRQVGVRDEAKVIGGIGMCGRIICCNSFTSEFASVSINMAKNQSLALVPSKISGVCGRLLCCLRYEDDEYTELKKEMPKLGSKYETPQGVGKVISQNVFLKTIKVLMPDKTIVNLDLNGSNQ